jgi:hypothetical protein
MIGYMSKRIRRRIRVLLPHEQLQLLHHEITLLDGIESNIESRARTLSSKNRWQNDDANPDRECRFKSQPARQAYLQKVECSKHALQGGQSLFGRLRLAE